MKPTSQAPRARWRRSARGARTLPPCRRRGSAAGRRRARRRPRSEESTASAAAREFACRAKIEVKARRCHGAPIRVHARRLNATIAMPGGAAKRLLRGRHDGVVAPLVHAELGCRQAAHRIDQGDRAVCAHDRRERSHVVLRRRSKFRCASTACRRSRARVALEPRAQGRGSSAAPAASRAPRRRSP